MLEEGLNKIEENKVLKLEIFRKNGINFSGHSLLVKKIPHKQYIYFDPNYGEFRGISFHQLCNAIDIQLQMWKGTDIFLTSGDRYLQRLRKN